MPVEKQAWDVFICHASEDKDIAARPLANELAAFGLRIWLDEAELKVGDRLRVKIDEGLANSRFGIVILSEAFFQKEWTKSELEGLLSRERDGNKVVLPVWHRIDGSQIAQVSPILGGRIGIRTSEGLEVVARKIHDAIRAVSADYTAGVPLFAGALTKSRFMSLPEGCFLLGNAFNLDLSPKVAEAVAEAEDRETQWQKLRREGLSKGKFYVFHNAAEYRAHMAARRLLGVARKS